MNGYKRGTAHIFITNREIVVTTRSTYFNDFCDLVRAVVDNNKPTYLNLKHDDEREKPTKFISNKIEALWFEEEK